MSKKIIVISTSPRIGGNSDLLANAFIEGARQTGNEVEKIQLVEKTIQCCRGCLTCHQTNQCFIKDEASELIEKMKQADVIVFATPVYYYGMCGQMKMLLDRTNPLYTSVYQFKDIYLLATAADEEDDTFDGTIQGLNGWIRCYEHVKLKGKICVGGVTQVGDIQGHIALKQAVEMGQRV